MLLKSATLVTLDPLTVEKADLRISAGLIETRDTLIEPLQGEEVIDQTGRIIMPGMVCAHTHLYSALSRGMPAPPRIPTNFKEILELIWWRLDRALDEETIYWSALAGALDAARSGTTCLFDHHSSPSRIKGSLNIVNEAIKKVGLRSVLCYEVTDRGGSEERDIGILESRHRLKETDPLTRGLVGAHASFTLSDDSLEKCAALIAEFNSGLHIHVAEDKYDVEDSLARYGCGVIERLSRLGALNERTILAHGTHLTDRDIEIAREAKAWFAHNPRSNMNNQVGYAPVEKFGSRLVLGTDGIGADMFEETRIAFFKGRDEKLSMGADAWVKVIANNQRLASQCFGTATGSLAPGDLADLVILNYPSPTPFTADNVPWHLMFGLTSSCVESVVVAGRFVVTNRTSSLDEQEIKEKAQQAAVRLWSQL